MDPHYLQTPIFKEISTIYKLPYSKKYPIPTTISIDESQDYLSHLLREIDRSIITGDINIPCSKTDKLDTTSLNEILELYNL